MAVQFVAHRFEDKQRSDDVKVHDNIDFSALLLSPVVQDGLTKAGFVKPSPIQLQAIPLGKFGLDLIIQAKSGTGKTCIFAVIALENIILECTSVQTLVLTPTREIASQICEVVLSIGNSMPSLRCHYFIGGLPLAEDKVKLKKCHIAVGTPGRIKQLIECKYLNTNGIRLFVLDEADKLLDKDFQKSINWIYRKLPHNKQMLALSATYPDTLANLLTNYMRSPAFVRLNTQKPALLGVIQFYTITKFHPLPHVAFQHKFGMLQNILTNIPFSQCLIFINLQSRAQLLCDKLNTQGWTSTYICGNQSQLQRLRTMAQLKSFQCRILVTTDLTARGIDCQNVDVIINVDLPKDLETYLHRIGRAGRFGSKGLAISIVSDGSEKDSLFSMNLSASLDICELPQPLSTNVWNYNMKECSRTMEASRGYGESDSFISILNDNLLNNEEKILSEDSYDNGCNILMHEESNASASQYSTTKSKEPYMELNAKSEGSETNESYSTKGNKFHDVISDALNKGLEEKEYDNNIPSTVMKLKEGEGTNREDNFQCIQQQNVARIRGQDECLSEPSSKKLADNLELTDTKVQSPENASCKEEKNNMYKTVNDLMHFYTMMPCVKDTSYTKILQELDNFEVQNEFFSSEQHGIYIPSEKLLEEIKNFLHHSNEKYWKCIEATMKNNNREESKKVEFPVPSSSHEPDFRTLNESIVNGNNMEIKHPSADDYKVSKTNKRNKNATSLLKSRENKSTEDENGLLQTYNQLKNTTQEIINDAAICVTNVSKDWSLVKGNKNEGDIKDNHFSENPNIASINGNLDLATTNKNSKKEISESSSLPLAKLNNYKKPSSNATFSAKNKSNGQKCNTSLSSSTTKSCSSQQSDSEEITSSESEVEQFEDILQDNFVEQTFVAGDCCSPALSQSYAKERHVCDDDITYMSSNWNAQYGKGFPFEERKSCCERLSCTPDCWQQSDYGYCSAAQAENNYGHLHHKSQCTANFSEKCYMQYRNEHKFNPNCFIPTKMHGKFGHFNNVCYSCYWDQCYAASQNWCYYYSIYMSEMLRWKRSQKMCSCCK